LRVEEKGEGGEEAVGEVLGALTITYWKVKHVHQKDFGNE